MLRMTPLASAIVALLLGIEAYAAEETFDTHFMIGGMKTSRLQIFVLMIINPYRGSMTSIFMSISNGAGNMRLLLKTTRKKHVYQEKLSSG